MWVLTLAWPEWDANGLVFPYRLFPSRRGTPLEPDTLRRGWGWIREAAMGVAPHVVRGIVGHSDVEVTMTIYAHRALDDKRAALRKLGMRSAEDVAVRNAPGGGCSGRWGERVKVVRGGAEPPTFRFSGVGTSLIEVARVS